MAHRWTWRLFNDLLNWHRHGTHLVCILRDDVLAAVDVVSNGFHSDQICMGEPGMGHSDAFAIVMKTMLDCRSMLRDFAPNVLALLQMRLHLGCLMGNGLFTKLGALALQHVVPRFTMLGEDSLAHQCQGL